MTRSTIRKLGWAIPAFAFLASSCATKTKTGAAAGGGGGGSARRRHRRPGGRQEGRCSSARAWARPRAQPPAPLIGRYMDKQEKALKEVKSAKVEREGNKLVVKFNSAILFDTAKSDLKGPARTDLTEFANVLKEYKDTDLVIEGHTDSTGKKDFNKRLSVGRADSVIGFLERKGSTRTRMTGRGLRRRDAGGGQLQRGRPQPEPPRADPHRRQREAAAGRRRPGRTTGPGRRPQPEVTCYRVRAGHSSGPGRAPARRRSGGVPQRGRSR